MRLRFGLDQVAAFRQGINTQSRFHEMDVDPEGLSHEDRELLASRLNIKGWVCHRNADGRFVNGPVYLDTPPTSHYREEKEQVIALVQAKAPTLEALLAAICLEEAQIAATAASKMLKAQEEQEERRTATQAVLTERRVKVKDATLYAWGDVAGTFRTELDRPSNVPFPLISVKLQVIEPDWPASHLLDVLQSPEAVGWLAELAAQNATAQDEAEQWARRLYEETLERMAREAREEEQREQRRFAQLAAWVAEHGTTNQQERYAEGLLPLGEILDAVAEEACAPLAALPRYAGILDQDVCTCMYGPCRVTHTSQPAEGLTEAQYTDLRGMRALLPEATMVPRQHTGTGKACESTLTRTSVEVTLTVGELTFTTELALD